MSNSWAAAENDRTTRVRILWGLAVSVRDELQSDAILRATYFRILHTITPLRRGHKYTIGVNFLS